MIYRILVIIALISLTVWYAFYQKNSLEAQLVSDEKSESVLARLPSVEFATLEEKPFKLDEYYQRETPELVVIHFWGTWCAPCEAELPELLQLVRQFENRPGVKFLLVAVADELLKVKKHLNTLPVPQKAQLLWLLDTSNSYRDLFGTTRVPETFVFSSDKTTLKKYTGPQQWNKPMFFQVLEELRTMSTQKL